MRIITLTCDNCTELIERSPGDKYPVTLKIQEWYASAWITLTDNRHLCDDCWPKVIDAPLETTEKS